MLKNKKAVYILIPLNILVWGFFAYRFYSAFNESDVVLPSSGPVLVNKAEAKDSIVYKLSLDYKDPFLKHTKKEHASGPQNYNTPVQQADLKKTLPAKKQEPVVPKQLPEIKYLGLIKNNASGFTTALVSVNGQSRLIKQNESMEGIVFKSFNKDSLVAKYGKDRIVVRK